MSAGPLQFVGSIASGLANTLLGQSMSKDLMDYQYQLQQQAIDKMNLYNSPAEQMKRLAAAKLNPNLVYGSGVDGNQSSAASPGLANRRAELGNPLQDAYQAHVQEKQLQMQEIENRNAAFESRERQLKLRAETLGQMLDNSFNDRTMETRIKSLSQKLYNDVANEAFTWSRTRNEDNKLAEIWANTKLLEEKHKLTHQQALTEEVKRRSLETGIRLSEKQIEQVASYIDFLDAGTDLRKQAKDIQELDFEAAKAFKEWRKEHPNLALTWDMIKELIGAAKNIPIP